MERVVLDVDLAMGAPGSDIDDGFALALALADPGIALELVTTVNGNTDADTATALTMELLHRLGRPDVPVVRGAKRPLVRPQARQGSLPADVPVREPREGVAAQAMVEIVRANPGEITLVAVGPLTNVALAMRLDPGFAGALKSLVIMGGVFEGQTNNAAMPGEFNIWCDPEAAAVVLDSGIAAKWVGLDVTLQVRVERDQALGMAASDRQFTAFAGEYTAAWIDHLAEIDEPGVTSCAMHDPLAVAAVTRPDLLTWRDAHVAVSQADLTRGVMVCDFRCTGSGPDGTPRPARPNASVAVAVDVAGFNNHFLKNLEAIA
ncbi:nucleoside hydrolase [Microbacterium sp. NPDC058389]|uniref:nucleoside hydrolase n=1 Tax=Microbacterium sp. NPDC058389 TaxID=3346475 RepID=UPI00365DFFA6